MTIVQFPHPGKEHKYSRTEISEGKKYWNKSGKHARNFIQAKGKYVEGKNLKEDDLVFWGEWEPEADMEILNNTDESYPKYLIKPIMPKTNTENLRMNTDPLVFGSCFKYAICRQNSRKGKKLRDLKEGSLIIFGIGKKNKFLVDTVFVVKGNGIPFTYEYADTQLKKKIKDYKEYKSLVLDTFNTTKCSKLKFMCGCVCQEKLNDTTNTFYEGATFMNPVNNMYSFVPAKLYKDGKKGFARLELNAEDFGFSSNLTRTHKYVYKCTDIETTKKLWKKIICATNQAKLLQAVEFSFPEQ